MSGGHYQYRTCRIADLAHDIRDDAESEEGPVVRDAMLWCAEQLESVGEMARVIEWYLSADYGPESVLRQWQRCKETK